MAKSAGALPRRNFRWIMPDGKPDQYFALWAESIERGVIGPLTSAANDAAAAAAGVPINGLYRNGNVVQIRLV